MRRFNSVALRILAAALSLLAPSRGRCALILLDGTDPGFWDDHAVAVCRVDRVTEDSRHLIRLKMTVTAVLATDATLPTLLEFDTGIGAPGSSLMSVVVHEGDAVLVCLRRTGIEWKLPDGEALAFFPNGRPLFVLGSDANAVNEVEKKVKEARRKARLAEARRELR